MVMATWDTLTERLVDTETGLETNRYFEGEDILVYQGDDFYSRSSFLESSTTEIDTLQPLGHLGLSWLENIGDIDGDGSDEIGVVPYYADYSNINNYYIYTFEDNSWHSLFMFDIHEFDLPTLPSISFLPKSIASNDLVPFPDYSLLLQLEKFKIVSIFEKNTIEFRGRFTYDSEHTFELAFPLEEEKPAYCWIKVTTMIENHFVKQILIKYPSPSKKELEELHRGIFKMDDPTQEFIQRLTFN